MSKPSFSIIMPIYNTEEKYLRAAIDSVLKQDYPDYELILVDDGSNDETALIVDEYCNQCTIIHQANAGQIISRLNGLKVAKNDYVLFFDSDDHLFAGSLKRIAGIIDNKDYDIITYDYARFKDDPYDYFSKQQFFQKGEIGKDEMLKQLCLLHTNSINNKIAKRELFDGMEKIVDDSLRNGEDFQQSTYLILKAKTFYYDDGIVELYRLPIGHRSYYSLEKLVLDVAFLQKPYEMIFGNKDNDKYYQYFYLAAINCITYNAFRVCLFSKSKEEKTALLNKLRNMPITKTLNNRKEKTSILSSYLFNLLIDRHYSLLNLAAIAYNIIFKLEKI